MRSLYEMVCKNLTGRVFRLALVALAAIGAIAPASMRAQAPGAIFTNSRFLFGSDSSGTSADYGVSIGRISANQRGDVFFINQSAAPNLIMNPAGTQTQIVVMSNLGSNSSSVATDVQGNLWVMNGSYGVPIFIPVTAGVYPTALDATKISANCTLPVTTANTSPCNVPLNYGSLYFAAISDIQLDASGNLYALDFNDNQVTYGTKYRALKFDAATMTATPQVDIPTTANQSGRIAISTNGDIFEVDGTNVYYSAAGSGTFTALTGFSQPTGVSSDSGGNIYVTETSSFTNDCIYNGSPVTCGSVTALPNVGGTVNPADRYTIVYGANQTGAPHDSVSIDGFGTISWGGGGYGGDVWRSPLASLSFGAEAIGSSTSSQSLPVSFEKTTTFGSFKVVSNSGISVPFAVTASNCTAGKVYAAAPVPASTDTYAEESCDVSVAYTATAVGPQSGTLSAYDNSGNLLGTAYLSGIGTAPLLNVDPGTASAIGSVWKDPSSIAVDAAGNTYVADSGTGAIYENGASTPIVTGFNQPSSIVVDASGDLYVADSGNSRIVEVPFSNNAYGTPVSIFTGISGPAGLAIDNASNLYLADSGNARVLFLGKGGDRPAGSNPSPIEGSFTKPVAVAADSTGNVYISDSGTGIISQYNFARGTVIPIVNGLAAAAGVAVDPGGNLYLADAGKQTITRVPYVSGTPNPSSSTTLATIVATPSAIAVDGSGNVYAADSTDATVGELNRTSGALSFGLVVEGQPSESLSATLSNGGTSSLTLGSPYDSASGSSTADFAVQSSSTCASGAALAVGGACSILSVFTPSTIGAESETLSLASNGGNASLLLSGTGTGIINATITGATTLVYGNTATYVVTVTADGTYTVNISGSASATASVVVTGGTGSFKIPVLGVGSYTIGLAGTIGTASLSVTPATLYATAKNASRAYGTANPVFQATISGAVNGDSFVGSGTTTATISSDVGTYPIVPVAVGSASANYTIVATNGVLTITQVQSNTLLSIITSGSGTTGTPVTFQATVTSATTGTPSGTVTFQNVTAADNVITIGTATLGAGQNAPGVATFTTSSLASGTIYVAAVYNGDVNFLTSTTTAQGLTVSLPSFTVSASQHTLQIVQGQSASITLTVTPVGNFTSPVTFSCQGLPLEASCAFSSGSVTPSGAPVSTTLTINTTGPSSASMKRPGPWESMGGGTVLALAGGFFVGFRRKRLTKGMLLFLLLSIAGLIPMTGCGLNEKNFDTPLGISTVTVTASSAADTTQVTTQLRLAVTSN